MEGAHQHDKGGRGSTATQPTHRELAPEHAAGKVPVPLGRECQWETTGQRLKLAVKLCVELFARELATCSSTVMPRALARVPTERGSFSPCLLPRL